MHAPQPGTVAADCCAHMALMSLALAPRLTPIEPGLLNKHFKRKPGPGAYYGQKKIARYSMKATTTLLTIPWVFSS